MLSFLRDSVAFCYIIVRIMEMMSSKPTLPMPTTTVELIPVATASAMVLSSLSLGDTLVVLHTWFMIERLVVKFQRSTRRFVKFVKSKLHDRRAP
jgi:hypothetical protein